MKHIILAILLIVQFSFLFGQVTPGKILLECDRHLPTELKKLSPPDIEFNFYVSIDIDTDNTNGDFPVDGMEATSLVVPGPAVGQVSTGIALTIDSDDLDVQMVYNLYEVDCETGLNIHDIFTDTLTLNGQTQPNYYSFANFILPPESDPYFINPDSFVGKCFKIEVIGTNDCGTSTAYSYFTVVPDFILGAETQIKENDIILFPNPVIDQLFLESPADFEPKHVQILDSNGREVLNKLSKVSDSQIDVSGLEKGIYFLRFEGQKTAPMRFVKL